MSNLYIKKQNRGFSLLAVMVAISILVVGVIAVVGLMAASIHYGSDEQQRIIALGLAQECIELVRNIRDTNWLDGVSYDDDIGGGANLRRVNYGTVPVVLQNAAAPNRRVLYINNENFYTHDSTNATQTIFRRYLRLANAPNLGRTVTCTVEWQIGSQTKDIELTSYLYDWKY